MSRTSDYSVVRVRDGTYRLDRLAPPWPSRRNALYNGNAAL